jgi:hypothetical protein
VKALRRRRSAQMGVESLLRRRGKVRKPCVTCRGVEEVITEELDARRALHMARAWVARL